MVRVTDDDKAIIALVGRFGPREDRDTSAAVLKTSEYNEVVSILHRNLKKKPADLWDPGTRNEVNRALPRIDRDRLEALMSERSVGLARYLQEIEAMGLSVVTRHNQCYPRRLKAKLGPAAPPILYVAGNTDLFDHRWLGIVGSRSADNDARQFTTQFAKSAVDNGFGIVSGGARGIDEVALHAALETNGAALAFLPGQMDRALRSRIWREAIEEQRAVLASAVHPASRFQIGNAMARNRFIYAQSEVTLVASTDYQSGGTWAGAVEALGRNWGRVAVRHPVHSGNAHGHAALVQRGAIPVADPSEQVWNFETSESSPDKTTESEPAAIQGELFS